MYLQEHCLDPMKLPFLGSPDVEQASGLIYIPCKRRYHEEYVHAGVTDNEQEK